jgi:hypothetical protein
MIDTGDDACTAPAERCRAALRERGYELPVGRKAGAISTVAGGSFGGKFPASAYTGGAGTPNTAPGSPVKAALQQPGSATPTVLIRVSASPGARLVSQGTAATGVETAGVVAKKPGTASGSGDFAIDAAERGAGEDGKAKAKRPRKPQVAAEEALGRRVEGDS